MSGDRSIIIDGVMDLTDEHILGIAASDWFLCRTGYPRVSPDGLSGYPAFREKVCRRMAGLDRRGKLTVCSEGSCVIAAHWQAEEGLKDLRSEAVYFCGGNMN